MYGYNLILLLFHHGTEYSYSQPASLVPTCPQVAGDVRASPLSGSRQRAPWTTTTTPFDRRQWHLAPGGIAGPAGALMLVVVLRVRARLTSALCAPQVCWRRGAPANTSVGQGHRALGAAALAGDTAFITHPHKHGSAASRGTTLSGCHHFDCPECDATVSAI